MKTLRLVIKIFIILLGLFIILMSFDSFDLPESTLIERVIGFFINASPGIILLLAVALLWKKEMILGGLLIVSGIALFFLFKFYVDTAEKWLTILTVEVPLLLGGIGLILKNKETTTKIGE